MSNSNNSKNSSAGLALTFGLGAAIGAATYYFLGPNNEEPQRHRQSRSEPCQSSGQRQKWRETGGRQEKCSICLEEIPVMSARTLLGCGHEFHTPCVEQWVERNSQCPICRQQVQ